MAHKNICFKSTMWSIFIWSFIEKYHKFSLFQDFCLFSRSKMPWAPLNFGFKTNALTKKIDSNESWDCIGSNTLCRIPSGSKILECHSQKELLDVQAIFLLKLIISTSIIVQCWFYLYRYNTGLQSFSRPLITESSGARCSIYR